MIISSQRALQNLEHVIKLRAPVALESDICADEPYLCAFRLDNGWKFTRFHGD